MVREIRMIKLCLQTFVCGTLSILLRFKETFCCTLGLICFTKKSKRSFQVIAVFFPCTMSSKSNVLCNEYFELPKNFY